MIEQYVLMTRILMGENKLENNVLVRQSKPNWVWVHLEKGPSPHAVIEVERATRDELYTAANLVVENSERRFDKNVKVIYTQIRHLKLTENPGEVILKKKPKKIKI